MISVIICTHNRAQVLDNCLQSILESEKPSCLYEILVINNNSTDNTFDIVEKFKDKINITYFIEKSIGLSHARNSGAENAKYNWLFYIDDDVKLLKNTLLEVHKAILSKTYDMVGGIFSPYYLSKKPKWFPYDQSHYVIVGEKKVRNISLDYVIGCVMLIKKDLLFEVGGFNTKLGMVGTKSRYAEESQVEYLFKKSGFNVGFNPFIEVQHLCPSYKFSLMWQLQSRFYKGLDTSSFIDNQSLTIKLFKNGIKAFLAPFYYLFKWATSRNYYLENYLIDTIGQFLYTLGILISIFNRK